MKPKTALIDSTNSSLTGFPLLCAFVGIWQRCRPAFAQDRTHQTGLDLAFGLLTAFGRRTISRGICARALQHFDWSRFYRFFSKDVWFPVALTHQLLIETGRHLKAPWPLVIGVDAYGPTRTANYTPRPKWRNDPRPRPSASDLATQIRIELWRREAGEQLIEFPVDPVLAPNAPKYVENAQAWLAQTVPKGLPLTAWSAILHADA